MTPTDKARQLAEQLTSDIYDRPSIETREEFLEALTDALGGPFTALLAAEEALSVADDAIGGADADDIYRAERGQVRLALSAIKALL
jgi:hypothetical protein